MADAAHLVDETQELRQRFMNAQLSGQRREAMQLLVDALHAGWTVRELQLGVVQEAQREIGRLWQQNRVSVAQEHMATAIAQVALAHLYQYAEPTGSVNRVIVVACVEGELHDFPARIAADVLELAGYDVRFLGADVPTESLISILSADKPDLLALSVTMSFNVPQLRKAIPLVRERFPDLPILVGGHATAWNEQLAQQLGADASGTDASALLEAAQRLLKVPA